MAWEYHTTTIYATSGSQYDGTSWVDIEYAWDEDTDTYAKRTPPLSSGKETDKWIKGIDATYIPGGDIYDPTFTDQSEILTVSAGAIAYRDDPVGLGSRLHLYSKIAIDDVEGSEYELSSYGLEDYSETYLVDITNDTTSSWTYEMITEQVDVKCYLENEVYWAPGVLYEGRIQQLIIKVDFRNWVTEYGTEGRYITNNQSADVGDTTSAMWYDIQNAVDGTSVTYALAYLPVYDSTSFEVISTTTKYLNFTSHNLTTPEVFNNVQIKVGVIPPAWEPENYNFYMQPVFDGTTFGDVYNVDLDIINNYVDITNDSNAPATWTWSDLTNLDVRLYGNVYYQDYWGLLDAQINEVNIKIQNVDSTSAYGLEVWDENGDKILSYSDRITRLIYTKEVSGGVSGSEIVTVPEALNTNTIGGFAFALEGDKISHDVVVSKSFDKLTITWTEKTLSIGSAPDIDSSDSLIVVVAY